MKRKVTQLAVYRRCLLMERDSRARAAEYAKSKDPFDRKDMVKCANADADEYKKLAELVKARKWKEAFKFWAELDTFVREGIPSYQMQWVAKKIVVAGKAAA